MPLNAKQVLEFNAISSHPHLTSTREQRFKLGDSVKVSRTITRNHTRVPAYLRGCQGKIVRVYGVYVFADTRAHGQGDCPQPLYSVRFERNEMWGQGGEDNTCLYIDMYDSYLESV